MGNWSRHLVERLRVPKPAGAPVAYRSPEGWARLRSELAASVVLAFISLELLALFDAPLMVLPLALVPPLVFVAWTRLSMRRRRRAPMRPLPQRIE